MDEELVKLILASQPRIGDPTSAHNYKDYLIEDNIVNLTKMAKDWNRTTQSMSAVFREEGYEVSYDRNKKYSSEKVITYVKIK